MDSFLNLKDLNSPFLNMVESPLQYLHKAVLKHPFYEQLINQDLKQVQFVSFLNQQERVWRFLSEEMILLSKLNYPKCINRILVQNAQLSLIVAGSLSTQLDQFKEHSYKIAYKEYIVFLKSLIDKRLFLPIFAAILPRFWLATHLHRRCLKLKAHNHPYKQFIKHCISINAEQQTIRIIQTLDDLVQAISKVEQTEMQQIFMDAGLHECELLNEAYKQNNNERVL
ncbi:hypothetical protein IM40_02170 [Candidatus Paracaedimonas acanthamoebae]|nr:hypothetical protein IM40_02170 [Candidatus Paracaedimonas acanthamoebae]